jgi:hypothetical protein
MSILTNPELFEKDPDYQLIHTFRRSGQPWHVHVLKQRKTAKLNVRIDFDSGWTDWPIKWPDGGIAYDAPEKITKVLREVVKKAYYMVSMIEFISHSSHWESYDNSDPLTMNTLFILLSIGIIEVNVLSSQFKWKGMVNNVYR